MEAPTNANFLVEKAKDKRHRLATGERLGGRFVATGVESSEFLPLMVANRFPKPCAQGTPADIIRVTIDGRETKK